MPPKTEGGFLSLVRWDCRRQDKIISMRSEAKMLWASKCKRGEKEVAEEVLFFFFFWGGIQDRKYTRGSEQPNMTTNQNNNKTQMQYHFFSTLWFPQQTHTPGIRNATGSEWGIHKKESLTPFIKHDGVLMSPLFSTVKDTQNKHQESKVGGKGITLICERSVRDKLQMGMWEEESSLCGGFLQWTHSKQRLDSEFKKIWVAQLWHLFLSSISRKSADKMCISLPVRLDLYSQMLEKWGKHEDIIKDPGCVSVMKSR